MVRLTERIKARCANWPDGKKVWHSARQMFQGSFEEYRERADGRANTYASDKWKWANYRLNFQLLGLSHSAAAVEVDPFEDLVRVIFFGIYVDMCLEGFEVLALEIPHSTWDPLIELQGPVEFPRTDGREHAPEVKFEFRSVEDWERHREQLVEAARCIYEKTKRRIEGGNPPRVR